MFEPDPDDVKARPTMKIRFLAGMAAGYVLGTRAGRERYDRMVQTLNDSDLVQQARDEVSKLRGSSGQKSTDATGAPGLVAPPVIVGPEGSQTSDSLDMAGDVVVPDLEPSASSQGAGEAGKTQQAKRTRPPAAS